MKTARTGPEHARMFMIQAVRRKKSINNGLKYILIVFVTIKFFNKSKCVLFLITFDYFVIKISVDAYTKHLPPFSSRTQKIEENFVFRNICFFMECDKLSKSLERTIVFLITFS